jgi:hypothetical protein
VESVAALPWKGRQLSRGIRMWGGWAIKIDIKSYFDTISHRELRAILD